jgi:hypothetical protein
MNNIPQEGVRVTYNYDDVALFSLIRMEASILVI